MCEIVRATASSWRTRATGLAVAGSAKAAVGSARPPGGSKRDDCGLGAEGPASQDVGLGRLRGDGRDLPAAARAAARRGVPDRRGHARSRRRRRDGQRLDPGCASRCRGNRERPYAELFDAGRKRAQEVGVELDWVEADAENLPFEDESFDVVMSSIGAMFAPMHQQVADELVRVCRPGGTIGMLNWTPEGMIGALFWTMGPFAPPAPPGAQPPPLWGSEDHVREVFGDRVDLHTLERDMLEVTAFEQPQDYGEHFKSKYGPDRRAGERREGRPRTGVRRGAERLLRRVEPRHARAGPLRAGIPGRRRRAPVGRSRSRTVPTAPVPVVADPRTLRGRPAGRSLRGTPATNLLHARVEL